MTSAICTALSAAPLRRLSPVTQRSSEPGSRRVLAHPADEHRVDARGLERRRVAVAVVDEPHTRRVAQQLDRLGLASSARWNRTLTDTAWPTYTGTRTQVTVHRISSSWRILRVSRTIFHSSDV